MDELSKYETEEMDDSEGLEVTDGDELATGGNMAKQVIRYLQGLPPEALEEIMRSANIEKIRMQKPTFKIQGLAKDLEDMTPAVGMTEGEKAVDLNMYMPKVDAGPDDSKMAAWADEEREGQKIYEGRKKQEQFEKDQKTHADTSYIKPYTPKRK